MRAMRNLFKIFVIVAATAGLAQGAVIFQDTFANNVVTNSDSVNGFWKINGTGTGWSVTESGGTLELNTTHDTKGEAVELKSVNVQSNMNFFTETITFSADIVDHGGTAADINCEWRFNVSSSDSTHGFQADDYIRVLAQKENNAVASHRSAFRSTPLS
jgi:hypothetical protein